MIDDDGSRVPSLSGVPTVVVDTSVHLSSELFAPDGSPSIEVIARGLARHFLFVLSEKLLEEIARKMIEYEASADDVADYLASLRRASSIHADLVVAGLTCSDPDDLFVMALARTSNAWCLVSHDKALLDPKASPPGWPPPLFLARLRVRRGEPDDQRFP